MSKVDYVELAKQWPGADPFEFRTAHPGLSGYSYISRADLAFIVHHLPEKGRYLEIGIACSVTAALIAKARPGMRVVCVDPFTGDMDKIEGDRLVHWRHNMQPNMNLWFGTAIEMIDCLDTKSRFDLAFVDADHTFDCTLGCLRDAWRLVKPGGIIIAHDWCSPAWPDVKPAVDTFVRETGSQVIDSFDIVISLRVLK